MPVVHLGKLSGDSFCFVAALVITCSLCWTTKTQNDFLLGDGFSLASAIKKADVAKGMLDAFHHVGLLFNGPPGRAGLSFNQSSEQFLPILYLIRRRLQGRADNAGGAHDIDCAREPEYK